MPLRTACLLVLGGWLAACGGGGGGGASGGSPITPLVLPPVIDTTSLPDATAQTPYSQTLAYHDGSGTPAWSVASGALPAGLTLSASGAITGTPTGPDGLSSFTAQIVDANGSDTQALSIRVSGTPGGLVSGFGAAGVVSTAPTTGYNQINAIVSDGSAIYLAGCDEPATGDTQWRIEKRSASTGALDAGFGSGGVITVNPGSGGDKILDLKADGTNLYLAGTDSSLPGGGWRVEKRLLSTGALVSAFGTGGVVTSNPSSGDDAARALALDGSALYIGGYDTIPGDNTEWRIEKRDLASGALVSAFGTGGVVTDNPPNLFMDRIDAMALDSAALYVAGGYQGHAVTEKRALSDGALDSGFGTSGQYVNSFFGSDAFAIAVDAVSTNSVFVVLPVASTNINTHQTTYFWAEDRLSTVDATRNYQQRSANSSSPATPYAIVLDGSLFYSAGFLGGLAIERRNVSDGSGDAAFGPNGSVTTAFGGGTLQDGDRQYILAVDASGLYGAGNGWRVEKRRK